MFTREIYDQSTYLNDMNQLQRPGQYYLLPSSTYQPNTCFQQVPEMHPENKQYKISLPNDMVNIESDLYNLNRPNTKDPRRKYPYINPQYSNPPQIPVCTDTEIRIQQPKLEGSQFNREKSIQIPRFESLCLNPQQFNRIQSNNVIGLDTRLFNRDIFRAKIPIVTNKTNLFNYSPPIFLGLDSTNAGTYTPYDADDPNNLNKVNSVIDINQNNATMAQENYNNLAAQFNQNYEHMDNNKKMMKKPHKMMKKPYKMMKKPHKMMMMPKKEKFCGVCAH